MKAIKGDTKELIEWGAKEDEMRKEIEEIKEKYPNKCICRNNVTQLYPTISCPIHGLQVYKDIQILLSSFEKIQKDKENLKTETDKWGWELKNGSETRIDKVEEERERLSKLLIEARIEIVELRAILASIKANDLVEVEDPRK